MTNKAVDDENADTTGTEIKSTRKPTIIENNEICFSFDICWFMIIHGYSQECI